MNCKPGDLALCIRGAHAGKTCEVISRGASYREISTGRMLDGWLVSFPAPVPWGQPNGWDAPNEGWYPDEWMRPIRDPGDDAVDETLQRLPAPIIHSQIKEDKSQEVAA